MGTLNFPNAQTRREKKKKISVRCPELSVVFQLLSRLGCYPKAIVSGVWVYYSPSGVVL